MKVSRKNNTARLIGLSLFTLAAGSLAYFALPGGSQPGSAILSSAHAREGIRIPAPQKPMAEPAGTRVAVFAGGCFWGIEGVFERVRGVVSAEAGYSGGKKSNANYKLVSSGFTSHAESVRIRYNPKQISYNQLLHIFFSVTHDPTQLNRQGPDKGRHYRTAIFPANAAQGKAARAYIAQLGKARIWKRPIVTRIEPYSFFRAEAYHQDFMRKNPNDSYIRRYDAPKVANLKRLFPRQLK